MKSTIIIMLTALTLGACVPDNTSGSIDSDHFVDSIFFEDGTLMGTAEMNKDSVPDGNVIRYYKNGQMQFKRKMKKGVWEGFSMYYYESGKVRGVENFRNNVRDGEYIGYYESGNKKSSGTYYNGFTVGWEKEYFDSEREQLKSSNHYVYIKKANKSYLDTFIHYDETGKIVGSYPYLSVTEEDDSVKIVVNAPTLDKAVAIVGDFDQFYTLSDSSSLDSVLFDKKFVVRIKFEEGDTLRGIVRNYEKLDGEKTIGKDLYFSYPPKW